MVNRTITIFAALFLAFFSLAHVALATPTALFLGPASWMTDPTLYAPLVARLQARGYIIRNFGLPYGGDLNQWSAAAATNPTWMSSYVQAFGTSQNGGLPTLGNGPIVVIGTSRAAYCAFELGAAYPQIEYIVTKSPAIELDLLQEFWGTSHIGRISSYALAPQLAHRSVFMEIGNQDYRVGTVPPDYLTYYIGMAATSGAPNWTPLFQPDMTLIFRASEGHTPPPQSDDDIIDWLADRGL